ncbi:MAG: hypothetical protein ACJA0N_002399 [Pseudohongiellaceae bacterium]
MLPEAEVTAAACADEIGISINAANVKLPTIDRSVILLDDKGTVMDGQPATIAFAVHSPITLRPTRSLIFMIRILPTMANYFSVAVAQSIYKSLRPITTLYNK